MGTAGDIAITAAERQMLVSLTGQYLPGVVVWAFGSRVKQCSRPESDLDLVAFVPPELESRLCDLRDELAETNLPFRVDLLNWYDLPDSFHRNIKERYTVL